MHAYSQHNSVKQSIPPWVYLIGVISAILAWILGKLLAYFSVEFGIYAQAPSATFFYAAGYVLFSKFGWRNYFVRKLGIVDTPDLNGSWEAEIVPEVNQHSEPLPPSDEKLLEDSRDTPSGSIKAKLKIYQSFGQLSVDIDTELTFSNSIAASLEIISPDKVIIKNQYMVRSRPNKKNIVVDAHEGTNNIVFELKEGSFIPTGGSYYTESKRMTHGQIRFS